MELSFLFEPGFFSFVVLPLLIFLARILDVSLGTLRIIFITKEMKYIATLVSFFEVLIWLMAITQIMQNLTNLITYIAYAGGFAMGTLVGIIIDEKLAMGYLSVVVITKKDPTGLIEKLETTHFRTTTIDAKGEETNVEMIFVIVKRKELQKVLRMIRKFDSKAFYSIEDVKDLRHIHLPSKKHHLKSHAIFRHSRRKGK